MGKLTRIAAIGGMASLTATALLTAIASYSPECAEALAYLSPGQIEIALEAAGLTIQQYLFGIGAGIVAAVGTDIVLDEAEMGQQ